MKKYGSIIVLDIGTGNMNTASIEEVLKVVTDNINNNYSNC